MPPAENPKPPPSFDALLPTLGRPGMLFAELVAGDARAGDRRVADALREAVQAGPELMPHARAMRFWRALLQSPGLRMQALPPSAGPLAALAACPPGQGATWLLARLSRLEPVALAALLGLPPERIRARLAAVEARLGEAQPECEAALENRQASLPVARCVQLASWASPGAPALESAPRPARWRAPAIAVVAMLTLGGLAIRMARPWRDPDLPDIRTRALAETGAPQRYDAAAAIALHPDRDLLSMPEADAHIARDAAFYAWYAAERSGQASYAPPLPLGEAPESGANMQGNADAH